MSLLDLCLRHAYSKVERRVENFRVFSYVIQRNEIISCGANVEVDHTTIYQRMNGGVPQNTLHAEYVAFRRAFKRLHREWSMVNIRIGKDMSVRLSKPCEKCQNFLRAVGCSKVLYTINANTCATLHL